jgi:hypothetical protein
MRSQRKIVAILLLIGFAANSFTYTSFQVDSRLSLLKLNRGGACRQTALCVRATTNQDDAVNEKIHPPSACVAAAAAAAKQPHGRRQALAALSAFSVVSSSCNAVTSRELMSNVVVDCCGCAEVIKLCESEGDSLNTASILSMFVVTNVPLLGMTSRG